MEAMMGHPREAALSDGLKRSKEITAVGHPLISLFNTCLLSTNHVLQHGGSEDKEVSREIPVPALEELTLSSRGLKLGAFGYCYLLLFVEHLLYPRDSAKCTDITCL